MEESKDRQILRTWVHDTSDGADNEQWIRVFSKEKGPFWTWKMPKLELKHLQTQSHEFL